MSVPIVSLEEAQTLISGEEKLLLGFKAPWCPQCTPQKGIVDRISKQFGDKVTFAYLDMSENEQLAEQFGITSLPTLIVYQKGEEDSRLAGFTPAGKLTVTLNAVVA